MSTYDSRRSASTASSVSAGVLAALLAGCLVAACDGKISTNATGGSSGGGGIGGSNVKPGDVTVPPTPISQDTAYIAVRKVKNLLTGMPPTDEDVALVTTSGAAGLQMLVSTWQTSDPYKSMFAEKMVGFFRNAFQQTGFTPTEDFKIQLLQNGGFDFGPGGARLAGDDAFPRLVQNLQDSFARTAWQLVQEGRPFTETLTTNRFVMTTALKSLYVQIEMPADAPFNNGSSVPAWHIDYSGNPIPIEQAISTLVFSDEAPATGNGTGFFTNCRGGATVAQADFKGTSLIFQRLLGFTPRFPFSGSPTCGEQASKPYFTTSDLSDWAWVTINHVATPGDRTNPPIKPYDLPALRTATTLSLSLPRVGFYTTPAFLALWNTNDSNQHRVTANQALLAALGQSFTSDSQIVPLSQDGLDATHAVAGTECVGCHKSLDPMRQFWGNQLDFNDRNDFPAGNRFTGAAANPRPATTGGAFAFGDVNDKGSDIAVYGDLLARVTDGGGLSRFGIAIAQDLCFWANSAPCSESDAEFRRVVGAFQNSTPMPYNFAVLIKEFFASPLVTGAIATGTYPAAASVPISISRRDHLCAALSNRLGKPDLCAQAVPVPSTAQSTTATIAQSVAADAFSRGSQIPVTPSDPTLFYRSASELLCSNIAAQVVDPTSGTGVYSMSDVPGAIANMVETLMGYPPGHPAHAEAMQILQEHYDMARTTSSSTAAAVGRERRARRARCARRSSWPANRQPPSGSAFKGEPPMTRFTRREGLLAGLFGTGTIGLRALATGLPTWYLLNPSRATAQDLQCAITARTNLQYLIVSTSSNGDPLNCNCPGTYENTAVVHPPDPEVEKATVQLGGQSYGAALPWADPTVTNASGANTGQLGAAVLARTTFFHYRTGTTVHGDQPKVMKLLGDTTGGEMIVSSYAKHLAACFSTVQAAPIAVGARGNSSELVSFGGRMLPSISPTQLKQLLQGARGDALTAKGALRDLRDSSLTKLNDLAKRSASAVQKDFLDKLALGQTQVRQLADTLADTLNAISSDNVAGQAQAAAALIAANVTPVVTVHIGFGGDNHTDNNLQAEADQHVSGIQGIQAIMTALANTKDASGSPLTDKVTFATMNVFGRNLNNISKLSSTTSPGGRDHFGNHNVMVIIGKNVKPSVIGGVTADSKGTLVASGIDSATGAAVASGGDIDATKTQTSAARTLGAALGIPDSVAANDYIAAAGGKVVPAALANLPSG